MASAHPSQPARRQPVQQVFKPRESLVKFTQFFPLIITGVGVLECVGLAIGYFAHMWLIPVMMIFPLFSTVVGATIANRLSKSRVVIDHQGLRVLQGDVIKAQVPWNTITRLTVRQERGDNVYEVWVMNRPLALAAAYYENGEQLLSAVSTRTNRPWERQARKRPS